MSRSVAQLAFTTLALLSMPATLFASADAPQPAGERQIGSLLWHTDYVTAYREAKQQKKMLFIFFRDEKQPRVAKSYESQVLASDALKGHLEVCVRAVLPLNTPLPIPAADPSARPHVRLVEHRAFEFQDRRQGIVIIDLTNPKLPFYGQVVSAHPFSKGRHYTVASTRTVLGLPHGTITQRTMLYVIRMHPERPKSCTTNTRCSRYLLAQAARHSHYMARVQQAGHQGWNSRFQQISSALGGRGVSEVAVSGNGRTLVEAAEDCLRLWRSSASHWSAIYGPAWRYGYDMDRAADGTWYATGLLAYDD